MGQSDSKMTIYNVRLHLRVLRRLSLAVVDATKPTYEGSALFFFKRNEELWDRKSNKVALQESAKNFDLFQAVPVEALRTLFRNPST